MLNAMIVFRAAMVRSNDLFADDARKRAAQNQAAAASAKTAEAAPAGK